MTKYKLKLIKNLIIYNYIYNNYNYKNLNFLKNIIIYTKIITRQNPLVLLNKKSEIIGLKTTLLKEKLNLFLYKLKTFTFKKYNTSLLYRNICTFDFNYNFNFYIKNQTFFFEYMAYKLLKFQYSFNIKIIFHKNITNKYKLNYIKHTLNYNFN